MNAMKTTLLLGLLSGILIVGGRAIAGEQGLTYGLILAIGMNLFSYFFSEKIALMSARAQRVSENQYPEIYARLKPIVAELGYRSQSSGLHQMSHPMPSQPGVVPGTPPWLSLPASCN
jgi:heat shock protein HtpX